MKCQSRDENTESSEAPLSLSLYAESNTNE